MKTLKYLLFTLLILPACKEEKIHYPGGISCIVNGQEWFPVNGTNSILSFEPPSTYTSYSPSNGSFSITANREIRSDGINQTISITADSIKIGLNSIKVESRTFVDHTIAGECGIYDLQAQNSNGILVSQIDTQNRTIKGHFFFSAVDMICKHKVIVTDGEFDFSF